MRNLTVACLMAAAGVLAACDVPTVPPGGGPDFPSDGACGAADLQYLVGEPAARLAAMTFPSPTRIVRPGDAVTQDYSPQRLNIFIDLKEKISSLTCG